MKKIPIIFLCTSLLLTSMMSHAGVAASRLSKAESVSIANNNTDNAEETESSQRGSASGQAKATKIHCNSAASTGPVFNSQFVKLTDSMKKLGLGQKINKVFDRLKNLNIVNWAKKGFSYIGKKIRNGLRFLKDSIFGKSSKKNSKRKSKNKKEKNKKKNNSQVIAEATPSEETPAAINLIEEEKETEKPQDTANTMETTNNEDLVNNDEVEENEIRNSQVIAEATPSEGTPAAIVEEKETEKPQDTANTMETTNNEEVVNNDEVEENQGTTVSALSESLPANNHNREADVTEKKQQRVSKNSAKRQVPTKRKFNLSRNLLRGTVSLLAMGPSLVNRYSNNPTPPTPPTPTFEFQGPNNFGGGIKELRKTMADDDFYAKTHEFQGPNNFGGGIKELRKTMADDDFYAKTHEFQGPNNFGGGIKELLKDMADDDFYAKTHEFQGPNNFGGGIKKLLKDMADDDFYAKTHEFQGPNNFGGGIKKLHKTMAGDVLPVGLVELATLFEESQQPLN